MNLELHEWKQTLKPIIPSKPKINPMSKKTTAVLLAVFFVQFASAQGFKAGIKFGTNINKLKGESFNSRFTFGYHAGAFAEIKMGQRWILQPEVVFNQINADTSADFREILNVTAADIAAIRLNYISIPLLANYKLNNVFMLQGGLQYGVLMNNDLDLLQNGKAAFKKGDFSVLGGVQVKLAGLRVYGRYAIGLQNISNLGNQDTWKSQSIQVGLGISII
jgi:hypothetical protein